MKLSLEAEAFLAARPARLVRFQGEWLTHEIGGFYRPIDDEVIRAEIRRACPDYNLTQTNVNRAIDEIKSATVIDGHGRELPLWLFDGFPSAVDVISFRNGFFHTPSMALYPPTNALLTFNALPFDYEPGAPAPALWLRFLAEVFDGDRQSIRELQKTFGYLLTLNTSLHRIFAIIGQPRSGKSTIGRVLEAMIGRENVCGPSFTKIGGDFGLQSFIGKQLAVIADARIGHRTDRVLVAERLLSISGEDSLDVARKHRTDWHGRLTTRILILSNELPALPDPSGALAARYVAFHTPNSFIGREDRELTAKLLAELPGVLNWALDGLRAIQAGEEITTPAAAADLIEGITALGNPVKAFVAECCTLATDGSVEKDALWSAYRGWHVSNGLPGTPLSKEMFGRTIKTAFPGIVRDYQPNVDGRRVRCWVGLSITAASPIVPIGTGWAQVGHG